MVLVLACGGGGDGGGGTGPVPVASVAITSPTTAPAFGALGRTAQFAAEARGASGSPLAGRSIAWSSSNASVAPVTPAGLVTAESNGTAQITATSEGVSSAPVTVTVGQVTASVAVTPPAVPFGAKGSTQQLAAAALDSTSHPISGKTATWTVTDAAVATVSAAGLLTSVANGATKAIGTIDGAADTADVTVAIVVKDVQVSPGTFTFGAAGRTQQFTATPRDSNTFTVAGAGVTWLSTSTGVATVNSSGLATSVANGTAQIQATSGTVTGSASVTVNIVIASVTLAPTSRTFTRIGQAQTFTPTARDSLNNIVANPGITWTSRNSSFVGVNASGVATSVADGATYVVATATSSGVKDSALVTVSAVANGVSITPPSVAFGAIGSSRQLAASVLDSGGTAIPGRTVTWSRVGPGTTATVGAAGLVTSVAVGTGDSAAATATGPVGPITAKAPITVTQIVNTITVTGSLLPDTLKATGSTKQFAASAADSNSNTIPPGTVFTWTSTSPGVATVDNTGLVSAVSDGSASIQASAGGKTGNRTMVVRRYAATFTLFPTAPQSITTAGGTLAFNGTAQDSVGTNLPISWLSRTTTVATVNPATGTSTTVTAVGNGGTYIVMSGGTRLDSTQVTVTNQSPPLTAAVQVDDNFFKSVANNTQTPAVDTIAVGGTVTWTWVGANLHSVQSTGTPSFTSSTTKSSGTYPFTFTSAGTYTYDCAVHGAVMAGRVVVR